MERLAPQYPLHAGAIATKQSYTSTDMQMLPSLWLQQIPLNAHHFIHL